MPRQKPDGRPQRREPWHPLAKAIGENVQRLRLTRKLTQSGLAKLTAGHAAKEHSETEGIRQETVSRLERGIYPATLETIWAVAKALGVQPWQLLAPQLGQDIGRQAPVKDRQELADEHLREIASLYAAASAPERAAIYAGAVAGREGYAQATRAIRTHPPRGGRNRTH